MSNRLMDRISWVGSGLVGLVLLLFGAWYAGFLRPLVDPGLVLWTTAGLVVFTVAGGRGVLGRMAPLDPARPSTRTLDELVARLAADAGVEQPRLAFDDSTLARAVANVGAVELGPRSATIVFTEQVIADLEARRFDPRALRGVVLHELGHLHHDHSYQRLWMSVGERLIRVAAIVALLAVFLSSEARAVLGDRPDVALAIVAGPIVAATLTGIVSRAQETQADAFAVRHEAGRELLAYLHWIMSDLGPLVRLDRSGLPSDPGELAAIRGGLERLIREAEAVADEERAGFFRIALEAVDKHARVLADGPGAQFAARVSRVATGLVLTWLGTIPAARTHPAVEDRIARIAAELGTAAA
ncbi:MAG TPA: M48 family metalloprotease [Candidatus Limnocylindrales bacterium]|nr:M48 family metalloprotease [Candidatus Limnocylindrales bacterium]